VPRLGPGERGQRAAGSWSSASSQRSGHWAPGRPCAAAVHRVGNGLRSLISVRNIPPAAAFHLCSERYFLVSLWGGKKLKFLSQMPIYGCSRRCGLVQRESIPGKRLCFALLIPAPTGFGVSGLKLRVRSLSLTVYCFEFAAGGFLLGGCH